MKTITVKVTEEEYEQLKQLSKNYETTSNQLLSAFVSDLTSSKSSGGSDERDKASEWYGRNCYRF